MVAWDAAQYLVFERERTQPAIDLARRIAGRRVARAVDVGCGPGNSTAVLAAAFPDAKVLGVDSSPEMLDAARSAHPGLSFAHADAAGGLAELPGSFDVVFSNACLQWVPDHPVLLARLMGKVAPGGVLAVQVPVNYDEPVHRIIREIVARPAWRGAFPQPRVLHTLAPEEYFDVLSRIATDFSLWQTSYYHRLPSHEAVLAWYRGTGLRPYLEALGERDRARFEADVLAEVEKSYPVRENGEVMFRFPRLFFVAEA